MGHERTETPFVDEVPRLMRERGIGIRALAREVSVSAPFLSRVLRQADSKTPSAELAQRVAEALGLPADYFREYREAAVVDRVRSDPDLRERLYDEMGDEAR